MHIVTDLISLYFTKLCLSCTWLRISFLYSTKLVFLNMLYKISYKIKLMWQYMILGCFYLSGVPENLREIARKNQPNMEISNSGDSWTIKTVVGEKVKDSTFKIGEEFDSVSLTGQPLKVKGREGNCCKWSDTCYH